jgi:protease-4
MTWGTRRAVIIIMVLLALVAFGFAMRSEERVPTNSVFLLDVDGTIDEQRPFSLSASLSGNSVPVMHDYVDSIDAAAQDSRVRGMVVRIGPLDTGWAKLEELRSHILAFRGSGKPSICYLGYDGIGNAEYHLASACDSVWMVPTAPLTVHGMLAEALFLRGTLDKLKIVPDFYHIAEYKTATNTFTEKKFTLAHREEVQSLLDSVYKQYTSEVAQDRRIEPAQYDALVREGPFLAGEALKMHLVDRLAYWDEVQDFFRQRTGSWNPVELSRYRASVSNEGNDRIAVIYATGTIVSGESSSSAAGSVLMGGDSVAADIRRARQDPSIKAIVLRVDSGGGSALASEVIRREVELARRQKPFVASMSDVAASGGYWIAMDANKIVAEPDTITASIGVITGKFNVSGLYALLGLSTDSVATSDNATLYSDQQNFTPEERAYVERSAQEIYSGFIRGVAEGRKLPVEEVDRIGKGRVWSGAQAKQLHLVDELGDLDRAIAIAKDLSHIPADAPVHLVRLPQEKSLWEAIFGEGEREAGTGLLQMLASVRRITADPVQASVPFDLIIK